MKPVWKGGLMNSDHYKLNASIHEKRAESAEQTLHWTEAAEEWDFAASNWGAAAGSLKREGSHVQYRIFCEDKMVWCERKRDLAEARAAE